MWDSRLIWKKVEIRGGRKNTCIIFAVKLENGERETKRNIGLQFFWLLKNIWHFLKKVFLIWNYLVLEWTVRCLRTVQFFVMFDMFEVQFWAKMWCSEMFEVQSCCYVTRLSWNIQFDVSELFSFLWCSTCPKFGFRPKCDVSKC